MAESERNAGTGDAADHEAGRLEVALARIARAVPGAPPAPSPSGGTPASSDIRARLDALIADIRAVLGRDSPD